MEHCDENYTVEYYDKYKYSQASWSFVVVFVPLVSAFGILSNCAFIFVVYRVQSMRNVTNIYLVNLALADSSLLVAAFSQYIGDYVVSPVYDLHFSFHTAFGCAVPNFFIYLCYYASLWTITLVSIERYLAICHTFWHRLVSNKTRAFRMILLVWIISLLFALLAAPYTPIKICLMSSPLDSTTKAIMVPYCQFTCDWCSGALYLTDFIQFFVAFVTNIVMYSLIIYKLSNTEFQAEGNSNASNLRVIQTRNAVAKMLIINGVIFFVCLAPFTIANIESIFYFFDSSVFNSKFVNHLGWAGRVLFLVNSSLNPLVYNVTNQRYRLAFRQAFSCQKTMKYSAYNTGSLKAMTSQISNVTKM